MVAERLSVAEICRTAETINFDKAQVYGRFMEMKGGPDRCTSAVETEAHGSSRTCCRSPK